MTTPRTQNVAPVHAPVTYRPARSLGLTVEREMVADGLAGTEGAAKQKLLELHRLLPRLVGCFHRAMAAERLAGFLAPLDAALDRQPVPSFDAAAVAEQEADGDEDTAFEQYRANPSLETWTAYRRCAHRDIARLTLKLRAGNAKWGMA